MRSCYNCQHDIGNLERIGRRDLCLHCGAYLHCCLNCTLYDPAYHNQCRETQAERQVDKKAGNFCEYFQFHGGPRAAAQTTAVDKARDRLSALFAKKK